MWPGIGSWGSGVGWAWASVSMWSLGVGVLLCVYEFPLGRGLQPVPPAETMSSQCCFETDKDGSQAQAHLAHSQVTRGSSYLPADAQWGSRGLSSG